MIPSLFFSETSPLGLGLECGLLSQTAANIKAYTLAFKSNQIVYFQQVLREVKVLANLSHSNVVGYHAAWLEYVTTDTAGVALPSK